MEKEFTPYEQALALKELGFDKPCFGYYLCKNSALGIDLKITTKWIDLLPYDSSSCKAPTYSQAFRWLYQKLDIEKGVMPLDIESQQLLLKELIDKVSSKHLLV